VRRPAPILLACVLGASLIGCGSSGGPATSSEAAASPSPPEATHEATPGPEPTSTPTSPPDAAIFGEEYLALSAELAERTCPLGALMDEAPGDPAVWQEAMAGFSQAWVAYGEDLASTSPPASVASEVDDLIAAADALATAADEIVGSPPDIESIYAIFDASYAPPRDEVGPLGDAIRATLELPPRDANPCD